MDWKEGAKWFGIIVAASAVSAVITMVLENHFKGTARAEARAEVDRVISAAVERIQTQQAVARPISAPVIVQQPKLEGGYSMFG